MLQGRQGKLPRIKDDNPDHEEQVLVHIFKKNPKILDIPHFMRVLNSAIQLFSIKLKNINSQKPIFLKSQFSLSTSVRKKQKTRFYYLCFLHDFTWLIIPCVYFGI